MSMHSAEQVWSELTRRGFGVHHLRVLLSLLTTARRGSWTVHINGGKIQQVDARLLCPPSPSAVDELEAALLEGLGGAN